MAFTKDGFSIVADCLVDILANEEFDAIACSGIGGLPIAMALKTRLPSRISVHYVRDTRKGYDLNKLVEGPKLKPGSRVWIVDDLINRGRTFDKVKSGLLEEYSDIKILGIIALVDFQSWGSKKIIAQGYKVHSLFTISDLNLVAKNPNHEITMIWQNLSVGTKTNDFVHSIPVIKDNKLIIGTENTGWLCCNKYTGEPIWEFKSLINHPKSVSAIPQIIENNVIVASYDGIIRSLDIETGKPKWQNKLGYYIHSTPQISDDLIFVGVERIIEKSGDIVCLNIDGTECWRFSTNDLVPCTPCVIKEENLVVCASNDRNIYGITLNGKTKWIVDTRELIKGTPVYSEGLIYTGSNTGTLAAWDIDGNLVWKKKLGKSLWHIRPLIINNMIIVPINENMILALDKKTNDVLWINRQYDIPTWAVIPYENGIIATTRRGDITKISLEGETIWSNRVVEDCQIYQPPTIDGNFLYLMTDKKGLVAFNL
jgi:outer membrane protein assembly factor BamB